MCERARHILLPAAIVGAVGLGYLLFHELTGLALPCPYRLIFHVYCPGCGVSRMFFHLFRGEIAEAFSSNCVVFCLLPVALIEAVIHGLRYIRTGNGSFCRSERIGSYIIIGILVVFGIVRNLFPIDLLIP